MFMHNPIKHAHAMYTLVVYVPAAHGHTMLPVVYMYIHSWQRSSTI